MNSNESSGTTNIPNADALIVEWALFYTSLGWPVLPLHEPIHGEPFPCSCRSFNCRGAGKHPRISEWQVKASVDPEQIRKWWTTWPTANVGVLTGSRSGICALDVDPRNGGDESFDALEREHGKLPPTVEALTGGGGRHFVLRSPDGVILHNRAGILPGIDFKGENGFIVVEPSLHKSGRRYGWEMSSQPGQVPVAPLPEWLLKVVTAANKATHTSSKAGATTAGEIPVGTRNTTLTSLAGSMQRRGMSEEAIVAALKEENRRCVDDTGNAAPLDDEEISRIAASVARYEAGDPAAGSASAESAAKVCADYIARIQETGDAKLAFDPDCLRAAAEVRETSPRLWADLCDLLRAKKQLTEWKRAVDHAGRQVDHERRAAAVPTTLPQIIVNDVQLRDTVADATTAIHVANAANLALFVRDRVLVRLVRRDVGMTIVIVTMLALYALLTRVANWFKADAHGDLEGVKPEKDVAYILVEEPPEDLPPLQTVISAPIFEADGTLINAVGYHLDHAIYFDPTNAIVVDVPLGAPSDKDVRAAVSLFTDDLLVDFPFESDADRAMAIGAYVLPFVRRMIDGCTPIHLFEAPTPGSGKTLIPKTISIALTGESAEIGVLPNEEPETRKKITALLASSPQLIVLDNAPQKMIIDSAVLSAAATCDRWTDRVLGVTKNITVRNQALWILTANNPRLSMEMARRCVRIRVKPKTDRPWERTEFKHPKIEHWTKEHRAELIRAIVIMVLNWIAKGKPAGTESLGSFENWAAVIGGILEAAGVRGFLKNQGQLYENADAESELWRGFTRVWHEKFGFEFTTVSALLDLCAEANLLSEILGDGSDRSRATRLGKQLRAQRDRVYGDLRIEAGPDARSGAKTYRVVRVDGGPESSGRRNDEHGGDGDDRRNDEHRDEHRDQHGGQQGDQRRGDDAAAPAPAPASESTTADANSSEGAAATVAAVEERHASRDEGDVGDVDLDVPAQRPLIQVTDPEPLTGLGGRSGPFPDDARVAKKKAFQAGQDLPFSGTAEARGADVQNVPPPIVTPDPEVTSDTGRSGNPRPPDVPPSPGETSGCARRAPRHCLVCGCPTFIELADGTLACADCPHGPVAGAAT
jgi:hypothetical protein